jgi:hypothetical protein
VTRRWGCVRAFLDDAAPCDDDPTGAPPLLLANRTFSPGVVLGQAVLSCLPRAQMDGDAFAFFLRSRRQADRRASASVRRSGRERSNSGNGYRRDSPSTPRTRSRGEARLRARSAEEPSVREAVAAQSWERSERRRLIKLLSAGWLPPSVSSSRGFPDPVLPTDAIERMPAELGGWA